MIRKAKHAGSWYDSNRRKLEEQMKYWLQDANEKLANGDLPTAQAIISPHAGYRFSGRTAAYGFQQIHPSQTKRIFIFGPSHHYCLDGCALTRCEFYDTPFYQLKIDRDIVNELYESKHFQWMSLSQDEDEHSIEMQLPFIAKIMKDHEFTIVPVLVGNSRSDQEKIYGQIFQKYFDQNENFFVISSDFCHWGSNFRYFYLPKELSPTSQQTLPIYKKIEILDREGIDSISKLDYKSFVEYLDRTDNTICGRNPIRLLLQIILASSRSIKFKLLDYSQSNHCQTRRDTSVSYVAAAFHHFSNVSL